jgi:hypothetical protein
MAVRSGRFANLSADQITDITDAYQVPHGLG